MEDCGGISIIEGAIYLPVVVYVTGFTKTDPMGTFSISRNTDLKY